MFRTKQQCQPDGAWIRIMNAKETLKFALKFGACEDAIRWLRSLDADVIPWSVDKNGAWMGWFAIRIGVDLQVVRRAVDQCITTVGVDIYDSGGELKYIHDAIYMIDSCFKVRSVSEQAEYAHDAIICLVDEPSISLERCADIVREVIPDLDAAIY